MYKQFVKNLKHFIIMNTQNKERHYRLEIAESILGLTNLTDYLRSKEEYPVAYDELSNIIASLDDYSDKYPAFKTLSWELWGYGFVGEKKPVKDDARFKEQLKLIDLLLGTKYWL